MQNIFKQLKDSEYYRQNKGFIWLLFAWLFRLCFLIQGNAGGLNGYVLFQIALILILFAKLVQKQVFPSILLKHPSTRMFAIIYIMGMLSIAWSAMPLLSCFFAFENMVCMTTLIYLGSQCRDKYQLERIFIWVVIGIIGLFVLHIIMKGGSWHSVTYSTVAAMLLTYCLTEYNTTTKPEENIKVLKYGFWTGLVILIITTSSGAIVSAAVSLFALALCAKKSSVRALAALVIIVFLIMWFSGMTDVLMDILFPGKSEKNIMTGHGRTTIWAMIDEKVAERPLLGWGYGAVERVLPLYCTDAHNSIVGIRGSLGNVGCGLLIIAMLQLFIYFFKESDKFGHRGIFVSTFCAFVNSNTYNFLAGKAGPATLTFQFLLVLGVVYMIFEERENTMAIRPRGGLG